MTASNKLTTISKFLSLVLRHEPERIGLELDTQGWTSIDALLQRAGTAGKAITHSQLNEVVAQCTKQRFAISEDGLRIRANQGHSIEVDLDLPALEPPEVLYHGTAQRFLESILHEGLQRRARHHVHLTANLTTATAVGQRYGKPVVLRVKSALMSSQGHVFKCSANGVWLVDAVPPQFLEPMT